jgi:hypothetical protein
MALLGLHRHHHFRRSLALLCVFVASACSGDGSDGTGDAADDVASTEAATDESAATASDTGTDGGGPHADLPPLDPDALGETSGVVEVSAADLEIWIAEATARIDALKAEDDADPATAEEIALLEQTIAQLEELASTAPKTVADDAAADGRMTYAEFKADPGTPLSCEVFQGHVSTVKLTADAKWRAATASASGVILAELQTLPKGLAWSDPRCGTFAGGRRTGLVARQTASGELYVAAPKGDFAFAPPAVWGAWSPKTKWSKVSVRRGPGAYADLTGVDASGASWLAKSDGKSFTKNLRFDPATGALTPPSFAPGERLGVSYSGATYDPFHAFDRSSLPRAGERAFAAGFSTFKLFLSRPGKLDGQYGSHLNLTQAEVARIRTITDLAKVPAVDTLFRSKTKAFFIDTAEFAFPDLLDKAEASDGAVFTAQLEAAEAEYESLCTHLLRTYENTGKVFVGQTWESDRYALPGKESQLTSSQVAELGRLGYALKASVDDPDPAIPQATADRLTPSPLALAKLKEYVKARQRATDRCRATVKASGVYFYNMFEINWVIEHRSGTTRSVLNDVIGDPTVKLDLYGWSAYSATANDGADFLAGLDYYKSRAADSFAFGGNNVVVSEISMYETQYPAGSQTQIPTRFAAFNRMLAESLTVGIPWFLYWTLYDDSCHATAAGEACEGHWIYKKNGDEGRAFRIMKPYLTGTDALVRAAPADATSYVNWLYWLMVSRRPTALELSVGLSIFGDLTAEQARARLFQVVAASKAYKDRTLDSPTIFFLDAWRILNGKLPPAAYRDYAAIYVTPTSRDELVDALVGAWKDAQRPEVASVALPPPPAPAATPTAPSVTPVPAPAGTAPFAAGATCGGAGTTPPGALSLTYPLTGHVAQRDTDGKSNLYVRGKAAGADCVEARTVLLAGATGSAQPWIRIADLASKSVAGDGSFAGLLRAPAGGWYQLEVRAFKNGAGGAPAVVAKLGIGEVFVIAGQSNSANGGETKQASTSGRVMRFDGFGWAVANDPQLPATYGPHNDRGSVWPLVFDVMATSLGVPIGLSSVGAGATYAVQWLPDGTYYIEGPDKPGTKGFLFNRLVNYVSYFGPRGVRAVLWHQGEADAGAGASSASYEGWIRRLIASLRLSVGYQVNWVVARTSFVGWQSMEDPLQVGPVEFQKRQAAIIAAQEAVVDNVHTFMGPNTNLLADPQYRFFDKYTYVPAGDGSFIATYDAGVKDYGGIHFSTLGLVEAARQWRETLLPLLPFMRLD